ncbi:MAG: ATP-binding cassette domain-containing protein [Ruminococcus sp.]|nr:ATP-binding cassette domain-containing protein [Ruminococcus sp.]
MSLQINNLYKKYGDKVVVNDLSVEMKEPGVFALLGTNGAGKTTTIRMILDILAKDGGNVLWNGKLLDVNKVNIGYLAEERGIYPKSCIMDQLLYFAALKGIRSADAKASIKKLAERLEVEEYVYPSAASSKKRREKPKLAEQLSKGNQQKIQLMAALISDPELLVLDEPLSGLDPINTELFKNVIREEIAKGKYIIMSSHSMPTVEEFCKDIIIMDKGKAVVSGNLNEIKKHYGRENLYVKCDKNIDDIIEKFNMTFVKNTPDEMQFSVRNEQQVSDFLKALVSSDRGVVRFELCEPSLHEIFLKKVGKNIEN